MTFETRAWAGEVDSPQEDLSTPPNAAPTPTSPSADQMTVFRGPWYGWQIWALDATTVSLGMATSAATRSPSPLLYFGSVFLVSGSILHAFHGQGRAALGSLALRAVVPLSVSIFALISGLARSVQAFTLIPDRTKASSNSSSDAFSDIGGTGVVVGAGVGAMLVSLIDGAFFAYDRGNAPLDRAKLRWYPTANVHANGANAGVFGQF